MQFSEPAGLSAAQSGTWVCGSSIILYSVLLVFFLKYQYMLYPCLSTTRYIPSSFLSSFSSLLFLLPQPRMMPSVLQTEKVEFAHISLLRYNLDNWYREGEKVLDDVNAQSRLPMQCINLQWDIITSQQTKVLGFLDYLCVLLCRGVCLESILE